MVRTDNCQDRQWSRETTVKRDNGLDRQPSGETMVRTDDHQVTTLSQLSGGVIFKNNQLWGENVKRRQR